jgi:hypothetical protein
MGSNSGNTVYIVLNLHYPWPPKTPYPLHRGEYDSQQIELVALDDGRIHLTILPAQKIFISQPIDTNCNGPRTVILTLAWSDSVLDLYLSGQKLLPDAPEISKAVLPSETAVIQEISLNAPDAATACQQWVQNRRSKFVSPSKLRDNRRFKTIEEQASDLRVSILRLRDLHNQVRIGNAYLLGTLAGEMRASIYWLDGKDSQPERQNNPLLLRMASLADLPLPVYHVPAPTGPTPPDSDDMLHEMSTVPRMVKLYRTDQICDLQESLITTVLRLGPSPGRIIKVRDLIKELAVTMGASHYDAEASDFLDVLHKLKSWQGNQVTVIMLQVSDVIRALSEWVLAELTTRKLIG